MPYKMLAYKYEHIVFIIGVFWRIHKCWSPFTKLTNEPLKFLLEYKFMDLRWLHFVVASFAYVVSVAMVP